MLNWKEPIKVAHLQKLANQSMLNGALVIDMANNYLGESKENFGCLIKRGTFYSKKMVTRDLSCARDIAEKSLNRLLLLLILKSGYWGCFLRTRFLKNFSNFALKHLCWSLFLIKLYAWRTAEFVSNLDANICLILLNVSNLDIKWFNLKITEFFFSLTLNKCFMKSFLVENICFTFL